jgi:endonuclease G
MASDNAGLRANTVARIRERIAATSSERENSRAMVATGDWRGAERDDTRVDAYTTRVDRKAGHAEASRGTNDFQPAAFLVDGALARRTVGRTILESREESRTATGFLISAGLFLTNQHVIRNATEAALTQILFDDELDERGEIRPSTAFALDPHTLFLTSEESQLDYALVAVGARSRGTGALADFGFCPLSRTPDRHQLGINANIVQHPEGRKKVVVLRNNLIVARDDSDGRLFYETDTLVGSSGSPVFNDLWDVIALHHYGEASEDVIVPGGTKTRSVNEGIRVSAIYEDLSAKLAGLTGRGRELLEQALVLWKTEVSAEKKLTPRPRPTDEAASPAEAAAGHSAKSPRDPILEAYAMPVPATEATIVLPLEITIRIGAPAGVSPPQSGGSPERALTPAPRMLAEAKRIDRDYSNRNGFDPKFVPGLEIDLAAIVDPVKKKIATLLDPAKGRAPGELIYENFSVVMHKAHRIAILTATNIDGKTYIAIDRKTGEPAEEQPGAEGDAWYKDTRINEPLTLTNDFYSGWSHIFDRGHLTRRNDPTWGANAARANADTFHFTNCSPQHWKFNESIEFWQGVERYVLEQGLWETGLDKRLSVLQGPLYDAPQPLYADDVEVPNAFWKIVIWKGKGGLKAVALVADQTDLLSIPRSGGGGRPDDATRAKVAQFRTTVADVASRSGLNLDALVPHDTAAGDLPHVGEAQRLLTSFSQIKVR